MRVSSSGLLAHDGVSLLTQSDPNPEPCHGLDKDKGEEQTVLEHVSAPASRAIRGSNRGLAEHGRRWAKQKDVGNENEGDKRSDRGCWESLLVIRLVEGFEWLRTL